MFSQNSIASLATEFEKLSRIMGAEHVATTFKGEGAFTDGKRINLPQMNMNAELDPTHQAVMRGYHIHEVSHVVDSDFEIAKKRKTKDLQRIWNACEDVYVERKAIEKYAGARKNLQETANHVLGRENEHWANNPEDNQARLEQWWNEIPYAALQQARKEMGYESEALDEYLASIPKPLLREARKFTKRLLNADSSEDAYDIAKAMRRRMNKLGNEHEEEQQAQQQKQQMPPMQGKPCEDGESGKSEDQSNDDDTPDDDTGNSDEQGDGDDDGGDTSKGDGDDDGDDGKGSGAGDEGEGEQEQEQQQHPIGKGKPFSMEDAEARAGTAMDDIFKQYRTHFMPQFQTDFARVYPTWQDALDDMAARSATMKRGDKAKSVFSIVSHWPTTRMDRRVRVNKAAQDFISDDVRQYAARLARLLLAQEDRRNEGGYASGRIDRRRLAQLIAGNTNVFSRTQVTKTSETRLMIAVDGSSSMDSIKTVAALKVVNECLGRANVKFDVTEWAGIDIENVKDNAIVIHHKQAHESYKRIAEHVDYRVTGGDTPTYSSLLSIYRMMLGWTEPRRICLFLTDGLPNGFYFGEAQGIKELQSKMQGDGIEVIAVGIGIGTSTNNVDLGTMFDKYVLTDFDALGKTMLGGLEKLLLEGGHAHAA